MSARFALRAGDSMPAYECEVSTEQLVRYAGASKDFSRQHWDHQYMVEHGFPGVIVHGWLTFAILCEAVSRWLPPEDADVLSFKVRYHRTHAPGPVRCAGEVVRVDGAGGERIELSVWACDGAGEKTTSATMILNVVS